VAMVNNKALIMVVVQVLAAPFVVINHVQSL
jgi:hypothetical protein